MYEWLLDYQKLTNEIDYLEYQLDREKRELKRWTSGDLSKVKLNEHSIASGLEERIAALEYELAHKMNDLFNAKKLISMFDGLDNKILYHKYVEGKKLINIADELDLSPNYIYSKHAEIMKIIKFAHNLTFS
ncbi:MULTISPECIES: hypothetical protein [Oceanobacillus]|uniref:Phage protein n=1 Tax=Oceanobacillus indicireducens TaxID=1004261 RepID=A0A917XYB6_9BACI|nr:hypothetical protein [Oceanobacillus indicireducens]GGN59402.1 hypothetical protein GCM10007971_22470 [Oceanobacillus indicireducens]